MKAFVLTDIEKMALVERPAPTIQSPSDVLIKMERVGVCGSDVHYFKQGKIGSQVVQFPFAVGHEGSGTVVEVGSKVSTLKKGDKIAIEPAMPCWECDQCKAGRPHTCRKLKFLGCPGQAEGCLQEYLIMPETSCVKISDDLTLDDAALSEPLAIGVYAVKQSIPMMNKNIGILGFGPIGMSVMIPAIAQGANNIYVTDKLTPRLNLAQQTGATYTGNPDTTDIVSEISDQEPELLDVVFECCGKQEALDQAIQLLKPGGKLMIVGIPEFDYWSYPADEMRRKEICVQNVRRQNHCLDTTLENMANGTYDATPMVTHRFPFSETDKAFKLVADYADGVMKAIIDF